MSESLDDRLKPVYEKRGKNKDKSKKQLRVDGKFATSNAVSDGVPATEIPQTKQNKTKANKTTIKDAPKKEDFLQYCKERCAILGWNYLEYENGASTKYDAWFASGWKDLKGNTIFNWRGKVVANLQYFKGAITQPKSNYEQDLNNQRATFKTLPQE